MAIEEYSRRLRSIKGRLSRYSHMSVLNATINHLAVKSETTFEENKTMPWVVMFLLKISMLGPSGSKAISRNVFYGLANEVFHLQSEAAKIEVGDFELKVRAMVLGQKFYQLDALGAMREILLQGEVFSRADDYYDNMFSNSFGLSLDSYLKITLFVIVRLNQQSGGVVRLPITELLVFLCPGIPVKDILAFIRLACCEAQHLPGFIEAHDLGGIFTSEYFQETPFKYIPFILDGFGLVPFNYRFCITALSSLAPAVFKKEYPAFKDEFGKDMELRVGRFLMGLSFDKLMTESDIKLCLRQGGYSNSGLKLVDYLVREGDKVTLLECKAIEPTDSMKCTTDPEVLRRALEPSYIKAIHQGQSVAKMLSNLPEFSGCSFRLLVVTYGDHYVFGGRYISENIDTDLVSKIAKEHGAVPISMDRISYLALQNFAGLAHGLKEKGQLLGDFLDEACDGQLSPETRRFTLAQVVEESLQGLSGTWMAGLGDEMARKSAALEVLILGNSKYWSGKAEHFMALHASLMAALNHSYEEARLG